MTMNETDSAAAHLCNLQETYDFVMMGCLAAIFITFGCLGNIISYVVFTVGRQRHVIMISLRVLAVMDTLYLVGYAATKCWFQFYKFNGK